jgi:hypothetical protein
VPQASVLPVRALCCLPWPARELAVDPGLFGRAKQIMYSLDLFSLPIRLLPTNSHYRLVYSYWTKQYWDVLRSASISKLVFRPSLVAIFFLQNGHCSTFICIWQILSIMD